MKIVKVFIKNLINVNGNPEQGLGPRVRTCQSGTQSRRHAISGWGLLKKNLAVHETWLCLQPRTYDLFPQEANSE